MWPLGCLTGEHLACRPYPCIAASKRFEDSKFNISNIAQAIFIKCCRIYIYCVVKSCVKF